MMKVLGILLLLSASVGLHGQTGSSADPSAQPGVTVLRVTSKIVIVDVLLQDAHGKPVRNLPASSFEVLEDGVAQTVRYAKEYSSLHAVHASQTSPKLPPGDFTNYTPTPPEGALNVLLLDMLNTPTQDQSFVRGQLLAYIKHANPASRIAILGLTNHLVMLQGFTSDPRILEGALKRKLNPHSSSVLTAGGSTDLSAEGQETDSGNAAMDEIASNLQQFDAEQEAMESQLRTQYTLDAFNELAHYLANFPGRKNLIWFSASFPLNILPDASQPNSFANMQNNSEKMRTTTNLLTSAQVAVYPVDARALMGQPMFDASSAGTKYARNPQAAGAEISSFNARQASEHSTMDALAESTGGRAYYNTNGLSQAVADAVDSGSNYYSLSYSSSDRKEDGKFRRIRVKLVGAAAAQGITLSYRQGYFANSPQSGDKAPDNTESAAVLATASSARSADGYTRAAMSHGAPLPQDIIFKVRVQPVPGSPVDVLAAGNQANPAAPPRSPFRTYSVDYAARPEDFKLALQRDGRRVGKIEFSTYVYSSDGTLRLTIGKTVQLNLSPETYLTFLHGPLNYHLSVSAPARDESFLRIAIRDVASDRLGVVEVSTTGLKGATPSTP